VIALGGLPNFFGIPGVEEHSLTDEGYRGRLSAVRNRVIERFEEVSLMRGEIPSPSSPSWSSAAALRE
jgi:NADH dehydrogenase